MQLQEDLNKKHALDMLTIFVKHSNEIGSLDQEGFDLLHEKFGEVDEDNRYSVFIQFTEMLDDRGIQYNKEEMIGGSH